METKQFEVVYGDHNIKPIVLSECTTEKEAHESLNKYLQYAPDHDWMNFWVREKPSADS